MNNMNNKVHNNLLKNIARRFKKYSYNFIYFTISAPIISLIFSQESRISAQSKYKKYKKLLKDQRIGKSEGRKPKPDQKQSISLLTPQEELDIALIRASDLFDEEMYLENNPDVAQAKMDPVFHYLKHGGTERDVLPHFDSKWYLDTYPDVKSKGMNPLVHYLKYGRDSGYQPKLPTFELRKMYDYAKETNSIIFEDVPERVFLRRPDVTGSFSGELKEGHTYCPPAYVSVLENATIFGGSSLVVSKEEIVLSDEMVDFNSKEIGTKPPFVERHFENKVKLKYGKYYSSSLIKEGILLSCDHDYNYFHWLVECLPKLILIDKLGQFKDLPLLIPQVLHANLYAALNLVNIHNRKLIYLEPKTAYRVEQLIFPSALSRILDRYEGSPIFDVDIVLSHKWISEAGKILKKDVHTKQKPWRKLFLTRTKGLRLLGNLEELERMLLEQNFEIVVTDSLSFSSQAVLFSQAAMIVAPTGAALTNMLFCPPGTKSIVLMSNHEVTNFYFWQELGDISNLDITIIAGKRLFKHTTYRTGVHDDFVIDVDLLREEITKNVPKGASVEQVFP
jgi:hypothetical protein